MFNVFAGTDNSKKECCSKKRKKIEHENENELLLGSFGVVLEVKERGENYYKSLMDLVEQIQQRASNVICNH